MVVSRTVTSSKLVDARAEGLSLDTSHGADRPEEQRLFRDVGWLDGARCYASTGSKA
jgi:hypothetical protein